MTSELGPRLTTNAVNADSRLPGAATETAPSLVGMPTGCSTVSVRLRCRETHLRNAPAETFISCATVPDGIPLSLADLPTGASASAANRADVAIAPPGLNVGAAGSG